MGHSIRNLVITAILLIVPAVTANKVPTISCLFENSTEDADYNDLIDKKQEVCNLTTLDGLNYGEVLDLHKKGIQQISGQVFDKLSIVTKVDLSYNYLTILSKAVFSGLDNVIEICLDHNQLTVADFSLLTVNPKLQFINYGHNKITKIQPADGVNITNLRLDNNNLQTVSDLCQLTQLEHLDLSVNHDLEWTDFKFKCWPNMKTLVLSDSNLRSMKNDYQTAFGGMSKLEVLNITKNGIVHHCTVNYPNLPALVQLNLNNNHLKSLSVAELVVKFPKLNKISLSGNAWNCDSFGKELKPQLAGANVTIVSNDHESLCDMNMNSTVSGGVDDSAKVCAVDKGESGHDYWFYLAIICGMVACICAIILIWSCCFCKKE